MYAIVTTSSTSHNAQIKSDMQKISANIVIISEIAVEIVIRIADMDTFNGISQINNVSEIVETLDISKMR